MRKELDAMRARATSAELAVGAAEAAAQTLDNSTEALEEELADRKADLEKVMRSAGVMKVNLTGKISKLEAESKEAEENAAQANALLGGAMRRAVAAEKRAAALAEGGGGEGSSEQTAQAKAELDDARGVASAMTAALSTAHERIKDLEVKLSAAPAAAAAAMAPAAAAASPAEPKAEAQPKEGAAAAKPAAAGKKKKPQRVARKTKSQIRQEEMNKKKREKLDAEEKEKAKDRKPKKAGKKAKVRCRCRCRCLVVVVVIIVAAAATPLTTPLGRSRAGLIESAHRRARARRALFGRRHTWYAFRSSTRYW